MLYPQTNRCRTVLEQSGFWEMKIDRKDIGIEKGWQKGFKADAFIGVPGSWNEQLSELGLMNYIGKIWYQRPFTIPTILKHKKLLIRFGSVDFYAKVWINGELVGENKGGYLPFEFDITSFVNVDQENILVLCVDNTLSYETIPQGVTEDDFQNFHKQREATYPPTIFDFIAYGGIHRPVKIIALHENHLENISIKTEIQDKIGKINFEADFVNNGSSARVVVTLLDGAQQIAQLPLTLDKSTLCGEFSIENCHFWSPEHPHLYIVKFELFEKDNLVDEYQLETGVREIEVKDIELLLNGKPIFLRGFGKHEDFPVLDKGLCYPLVIKDFQLLKWIGANSFRTSHYPYAEEVLQMADKMGFLVMDECPAVSLNFKYANEKTLANHQSCLTELIRRDRNHPSVICWSIANEPGIWGEEEAISEKAEKYWAVIYKHVKKLDSSRPITLPASAKWGDDDLSYKFSDFISINRYWGWYEIPGDLEKVGVVLKSELQRLFEKYQRPIMVTEFGADTIEGQHSTTPQLFTEEYQILLIEKYFEVIESLPFTVGEHIWNFADFRTAQHHRRVILNKKGVFNRQREPKSAAFIVRKHWLNKKKKAVV